MTIICPHCKTPLQVHLKLPRVLIGPTHDKSQENAVQAQNKPNSWPKRTFINKDGVKVTVYGPEPVKNDE